MNEQTEQNKQLIREAFATIFDRLNYSEETVSRFFHPNYQQNVDGKILYYKALNDHLKALFSELDSCKINFEHMVAEDDKVCTLHYPTAVKKNGKKIKAQVNALFQIKDNKIILCHELTRLIEGEKSDEDLGSRI